MGKLILLILSISVNIILIVWLNYKNKQLRLAYKIRVGYEKRCNSFRIRYTILSRMEDPDKIIERVKKLDKVVYIYGGGVIGRKLGNILTSSSELKILGFIEGKELENNKSIGENIDNNAVIIVTPVFDYDNIVKLLSLYTEIDNIISIDEIL